MSKQKDDKDKAKAGDKAGKSAPVTKTIALNKRARHEYHLEQRHEAGLALQGWELKSIRAGRANITDGYALIQHGELFLIGAQFTPLIQASSHVIANDRRTRKLLLHAEEIAALIGKVERAGYTLVPLDLHLTRGRVKLAVGLAKGKKQHDKRASEKDREWERQKQRLMRV